MVDITEEQPESENKSAEAPLPPSASTKNGGEEPADGWIPLMGEDIQLKDISSTESDFDATEPRGRECQPQDAVIVDFVGRLAPDRDDEDGPIFHEAKDWLIVIGEKFVNPGLEMGVRFMHDGQRAVVWAHSKFAYGLSTRQYGDFELPPNSNVRYEIKIKTIFSPEEESADPDAFQIRLALSKKQIANDMFKNEIYGNNYGSEQRALRLYSKAAEEMLHLLQSHVSRKEEEGDSYNEKDCKPKTDQATEIMLDCWNNTAAVYMKSKDYHEAKEAAVKVLTHDPNNLKALLRAARAAMLDPSGTYEEADLAIAAAEKVVEEKGVESKDIRKLRAELKQKKQEYKQRKKDMAARMQKGLQPTPLKDTAETPTTSNNDTGCTLDDKEESSNKGDNKWLSILLPYAFQILFPLVLYFVIMWTKKSPTSSDLADMVEEGEQEGVSQPGEL